MGRTIYLQFTGCIAECRYYAKEGTIEDEEWTAGMKIKEEKMLKIIECGKIK
jgi:hypothetical protein